MTDLNTMYRVIILFMLNKLEYPLTNTQITNFILEKDYTDYFTIQQTISDLLSSELVTAESTHSNTRYRITDEGRLTLKHFEQKISDGIKEDILSYFREHHYELKKENSIYANYLKNTDNGYSVHCHVKELEKTVVDLTLSVNTKEQAEAICANWETQSTEVYALLMDLLLK